MPGTVKPICPGLRLGAMPSADLHTDSLPIGTLSVVAHVLRKHGTMPTRCCAATASVSGR